MITTFAERTVAVKLAKHLLATGGLADDTKLLCSVVVDCAEVFKLHMPIIDAARRLVAPRGACVTNWQQPWTDLIAAVQALRKAHPAKEGT